MSKMGGDMRAMERRVVELVKEENQRLRNEMKSTLKEHLEFLQEVHV